MSAAVMLQQNQQQEAAMVVKFDSGYKPRDTEAYLADIKSQLAGIASRLTKLEGVIYGTSRVTWESMQAAKGAMGKPND